MHYLGQAILDATECALAYYQWRNPECVMSDKHGLVGLYCTCKDGSEIIATYYR